MSRLSVASQSRLSVQRSSIPEEDGVSETDNQQQSTTEHSTQQSYTPSSNTPHIPPNTPNHLGSEHPTAHESSVKETAEDAIPQHERDGEDDDDDEKHHSPAASEDVGPTKAKYTESQNDIYKSVLSANRYKIEPPLSPGAEFQDVDEFYRDVMSQIVSDFQMTTVEMAMYRVHDQLYKYRAKMKRLETKLEQREQEVESLAYTAEHDPRVMQVVQLADTWRKEKDEVELERNEIEEQVDGLKEEVESMTTTMTALNLTVERLKKDVVRCNMEANEVAHLKVQLNQRNDQLKKITAEKEYVEHNLEIAKDKIHVLQTTMEGHIDQQPQILHLEQQLHRIQIDRNHILMVKKNLTEQLTSCGIRVNTSGAQVKLLKSQADDLSKRFQHMHLFCSKLNAMVTQCTSSIRQKVDECHTLQADLVDSNKKEQVLANKLRDMQLKYSNVLSENSRLNTIMMKKDQQIHNLYGQKQTDLAHVREASNAADKTKKQMNVAEKDLKLQRHISEDRHRKLVKAKHETQEENRKYTFAMQDVKLLHKDINSLAHALVSYQEQNKDLDNIASNQAAKLRELTEACDEKNRAIRNADNKISDLIKEIEKMHTAMDKTRDVILKHKEKDALMSNELQRAFDQAMLLQQKVSFSATETKSMVWTMDAQERDILSLKTLTQKQRQDIAKLLTVINESKPKLDKALADLAREKDEVSNAVNQIEIVNEELSRTAHRESMLQGQRDIFGSRLLQSKAENELLMMKLRAQDEVLQRGRLGYNNRLGDMMVLKKEVTRLRQKLKGMDLTDSMNESLRHDLEQAKKMLIIEENKRVAIENMKLTKVHEMRVMKHTAPSHYESVLKNQALVKDLIRKTDHVVDLEEKLIALNKDHFALKTMVASRHGPDLASDTTSIKADLRTRDKRIKSLLAELNMTKDDLALQKKQCEQLEKELGEAKYPSKKPTTLQSASRKSSPLRLPAIKPNPTGPHKTGGGFLIHKRRKADSYHKRTATTTYQTTQTNRNQNCNNVHQQFSRHPNIITSRKKTGQWRPTPRSRSRNSRNNTAGEKLLPEISAKARQLADPEKQDDAKHFSLPENVVEEDGIAAAPVNRPHPIIDVPCCIGNEIEASSDNDTFRTSTVALTGDISYCTTSDEANTSIVHGVLTDESHVKDELQSF